MRYYRSNALYDFLLEKGYQHFKFTSGDLWQLIYGDINCIPKLLVVASGVKSERYLSRISENEKEAMELLEVISRSAGIPLRFVRFIIDVSEIDEVITFRNSDKPQKVTMAQLKGMFQEEGLPVSNNSTAKYLNDATSSAYHNWQEIV